MLWKVRNGTLARTSGVCVSLIPSEGILIFQRMLLPVGSYKYLEIMALTNHGQAYNSTGATIRRDLCF